jgi:hypothetical protein
MKNLSLALCLFAAALPFSPPAGCADTGKTYTPAEIIAALRSPTSSTGNIADAVDEATGQRGFMSHDMKPIFRTKIVGRAATALLRPVLKTDARKYPNYQLQILDEAEPGSVLVYVLEDGLDIAGMGNLMATTAKVRGLEGAVIDGAARDIGRALRERCQADPGKVRRHMGQARRLRRWRLGRRRGGAAGCGQPGGRAHPPIRLEGKQNAPHHRGAEIDAQSTGAVQPVLA